MTKIFDWPGEIGVEESRNRTPASILIFDEVTTAFGRVGVLTMAEGAGVAPDLMVLGKGTTSAYAPMAALAAVDPQRQARPRGSAPL